MSVLKARAGSWSWIVNNNKATRPWKILRRIMLMRFQFNVRILITGKNTKVRTVNYLIKLEIEKSDFQRRAAKHHKEQYQNRGQELRALLAVCESRIVLQAFIG